MGRVQFGCNVLAFEGRDEFTRLVRQPDQLGYSLLAAPDHVGMGSPFAVLTAAAAISDRLRLRTYVLNVGFWNPALLAREVATVDAWSGGRLEVGLGAGHMKSEHDDAGLPWPPLDKRIARLSASISELRRRLADEDHRPRPVQRPVPVLVGAMSRPGLDVAARLADIVGFAGLRQVRGQPPGTFTFCSAAETRERVEQVRVTAAGRAYRSDLLLQVVSVDEPPAACAQRLAAGHPHISPDQLDTPFALLAESPEQGADELLRRCATYRVSSVVTHHPNLEALGQVIAVVQARDG